MINYRLKRWVFIFLLSVIGAGCDTDDKTNTSLNFCKVLSGEDGGINIACYDDHSVDAFYGDSTQGRSACEVVNDDLAISIVCRDKEVITYTPGTDGRAGQSGQPGVDGRNALMRLHEEDAGNHCEFGGTAVHSGLDTNGNGILDEDEVSATTYICNGDNGWPGIDGSPGQSMPNNSGNPSLVRVLAEPQGNHCTRGGYRIEIGHDLNGDGHISNEEITEYRYICHGKTGTQGAQGGIDGDDEPNALIQFESESPGDNCPDGGIALQTGLDEDHDGALSTQEISEIYYICQGEQGVSGSPGGVGNKGNDGNDARQVLIRTLSEPAGENCPGGGVVILVGLDANQNGVLDNDEINSEQTNYICNIIGTAVFRSQPNSAQAGASIGSLSVEILSADGNLMEHYSGDAEIILVHNPGQAQFLDDVQVYALTSFSNPQTIKAPVVDGVATFDEVALDKANSGYRLSTSIAGISEAISESFDITPGPPSDLFSTIEAVDEQPVMAGENSTIRIQLMDAYENPIEGVIPDFEATGTDNSYSPCSTTDENGVSTCLLSSTVAEEKDLSITLPITKQGPPTSFVPGPADADFSSISGTTNIVVDGQSTSVVTIILADQFNNYIEGIIPQFEASGSDNIYGDCTMSNNSGESICSMRSTRAEFKTLSLTYPETIVGDDIEFIPGPPNADTSEINVAPGYEEVDAGETLTVQIIIRDEFGNPIEGIEPEFEASGDGNDYDGCTSTDEQGLATCTMRATTAEPKSLSLIGPVTRTGSSTFVCMPGEVSTTTSGVVISNNHIANGVDAAQLEITLSDAFDNPIVDVVPTFSASGTGNSYGTCSATNSQGVATCTMTSTVAQTKTITVLSPFNFTDGTTTFVAGPATSDYSSITGTSNVRADGTSIAEITIIIRDAFNNPISGVEPEFSASGTGNGYGSCSTTNASGTAICSMTSTVVESKELSIVSPISMTGDSIEFVDESHQTPEGICDPIIFTSSTFPPQEWTTGGDGGWIRDSDFGSVGSSSARSATIDDGQQSWFETTYEFGPGGGTVEFEWTVSSQQNYDYLVYCENLEPCTASNYTERISGVSLSYAWREISRQLGEGEHHLRWAYIKNGSVSHGQDRAWIDNIRFTHEGGGCHDDVDPTNSSIVGPGTPIYANGLSTALITITLRDAHNQGVQGLVPAFDASGSDNIIGACSITDSDGISTCTLSSSQAETKILSLQWPVEISGDSVVFEVPPPAETSNSSIEALISNIPANGVSKADIRIVLRDVNDEPVLNVVPTFDASGAANYYHSCTPTDENGESLCAISSSETGIKTLEILTPISLQGGTVEFITPPPAHSSQSSIQALTTGIRANGFSEGTIEIILYDEQGFPIIGETPTFEATGSGNAYGACSSSDDDGLSECTMTSTEPGIKTLSLLSPITLTGGDIVFDAANFINGCDPENLPFGGGSGDISDPYLICHPAQLNQIGAVSQYMDKAFQLTTDLNMGGYHYQMIGDTISGFNGVLDGNFHTISNIVVNDGGSYVGLIRRLNSDGIIKNIGIVDAYFSGGANVGGLVGYSLGRIENAFSGATIYSSSTYSGGLVGRHQGGQIIDAYSFGELISTTTSISNATGGAVGLQTVNTSEITRVYARGLVSAQSNGGGLIGNYHQGSVNHAYWDIDTTGQATSSGAGALGLSAAQMAEASNYDSSWVFYPNTGYTWIMHRGYPQLAWEIPQVHDVNASNSTISGESGVRANGLSTASIHIYLRDAQNDPVVGITPLFEASGTGNSYDSCTDTDENGLATCTMRATEPGMQTLSITWPVEQSGGTIEFEPTNIASADTSTIEGTTDIWANGFWTSAIVISLKDVDDEPVAGIIPTFQASGGGNAYTPCSVSDTTGVSTCTMTSTEAGIKSLEILSPIGKVGGNIEFLDVQYVDGCDPTMVMGGGDGSPGDPYLICTPEQLNEIGGKSEYMDKNFMLASDIDMDGHSYNMIGTSSSSSTFSGVFDGNYKKIFNLHIPRDGSTSYHGFIRWLGSGGVIRNLAIVDSTIEGWNYVGAFVGNNYGTVENSYTTATVIGASIYVGGLVGYQASLGTVMDSYFAGELSSTTSSSSNGAGGIVGYQTGASTNITRTYARGLISANRNGGGILGNYSNGTITHSYWDMETTGQNASSGVGATGLTTEQMADLANYDSSWVFHPDPGYTWVMHQGYPRLAWELPQIDTVDTNNSSITTSDNDIYANGVSSATITIELLDDAGQGVSGISPRFEASGAGNSYSICSETGSDGLSTCTMTSTVDELKTLQITWPINKAGDTIEFVTPNSADAQNSTITGTSNIPANGYWWSTITITLNDSDNQPVAGVVPTFDATGSGNSYGDCSATNLTGESTCTLTSTTPETKTLALISPIAKTGDQVEFIPVGVVDGCDTTMDLGGGNGTELDPYLICTPHQFNIMLAGMPHNDTHFKLVADIDFDSESMTYFNNSGTPTGFGGVLDGNDKTISNVVLDDTSQNYVAVIPWLSANGVIKNLTISNVYIRGRDYVGIVGRSLGTIENITVVDAQMIGRADVGGIVGYKTQGSIQNASVKNGLLTGEQNVGVIIGRTNGTTVNTVSLSALYASGQIQSSGNAGGLIGSLTNTHLQDAFASVDVTSDAPGYVGGLIGYAANIATIARAYASGEVVLSNGYGNSFSAAGGLIGRGHGVQISQAFSYSKVRGVESAVGGLVGYLANHTLVSATIEDSYAVGSSDSPDDRVGGLVGQLAGGDLISSYASVDISGEDMGLNIGPIIGMQNESQSSLEHIYYRTSLACNNWTTGECNTIGTGISDSALSDINTYGNSWHFAPDVDYIWVMHDGRPRLAWEMDASDQVDLTHSQIEGTTNIAADGYSHAEILITLKNSADEPIIGVQPTFEASGSGNSYGECSFSDSDGIAECELRSTVAEEKTLQINWPVTVVGATIEFTTPPVADASNSSISGISNIPANGQNPSLITIVLRDAINLPVAGQIPTFEASGSGNIYGDCTVSNHNGESYCMLLSTVAEIKTLSLLTPINLVGDDVEFFDISLINGCDPYASLGGGTGTAQDPHLICAVEQLDTINARISYLNRHYQLVTDLDMTGHNLPLIGRASGFGGVFDGNAHKLMNLESTDMTASNIGVFRYINENGEVHNLGVENAALSASQGVGGLAAANDGLISDSYVANGVIETWGYAGGLVGYLGSTGVIHNSSADVDVYTTYDSGGLVGVSYGYISQSHATGNLAPYMSSGSSYEEGWTLGGLVGQMNAGSIATESFASGHIISISAFEDDRWSQSLGGLVGDIVSSNTKISAIYDSHATGDVVGVWSVGGLVGSATGFVAEPVIIERSFASGNISGTEHVGGFVGYSARNVEIRDSFAHGNINAITHLADGTYSVDAQYAGGFVGQNQSAAIYNSYSAGSVESDGDYAGGFAGAQSLSGGASPLPALMQNIYAIGDTISQGTYIGGLVGGLVAGDILNAYAQNNVEGVSSAANIGPLFGRCEDATAFYSAVFYDNELDCINHGEGAQCNAIGQGRTASQIADPANYPSSWIFEPQENWVWTISNQRPILWWEVMN